MSFALQEGGADSSYFPFLILIKDHLSGRNWRLEINSPVG